MREVVLRVPRSAAEDVLDRLLLMVPSGVRELPAGRHVELKLRGDDLPPVADLRRAVGRWPVAVTEGEVPDDWRARRAADYKPDLIAGRLVVRPEWAPPSGAATEIVLRESSAFGGGTHPTTRTCLELLLELTADGGFADLGCGTGVLAVLAAKLGWHPVTAIDIQPGSVEAARVNAEQNGVRIEARVADLAVEPAPPARAFAANVPTVLHRRLAGGLAAPPRTGLLSGFGASEADDVVTAYAGAGLEERRRIDVHGWTVLVMGG